MEFVRSPRKEIFRSTRASCLRHALVLQAGGIEHEIQEGPDSWALLVAPEDVARAAFEIKAYGEEQAEPPAPASDPAHHGGAGWVGVAGYVVVLLLTNVLSHGGSLSSNWLDSGKMQVGLVRQGELWRSITALSLHGDLLHLFSNLAIGGLVGLFAGQMLGSGLAWLNILIGGAVGNLLTALFRPASHNSIGASTAVFAALGLLAGYGWIVQRRTRTRALARYGPIIGAALLLSYLGTSGDRTDVLAHVMGFLSGLALGAFWGTQSRLLPLGRGAQVAMGATAAALLASAWLLALA